MRTTKERFDAWTEFFKTEAFKNMQDDLKKEGWSIMFYSEMKCEKGGAKVEAFDVFPMKEE